MTDMASVAAGFPPGPNGFPAGQAVMASSAPVTLASDQQLPNYVTCDGVTYTVPRAANIFKTITSNTNTNVALWTPTSGKKFRVLKWWIEVSLNAAQATGGAMTVSLLDSSTQVGLARTVSVPGAAGTTGGNLSTQAYDIGPIGYLSSAANNVLNVLIAANLSSGTIRVSVAGTEE